MKKYVAISYLEESDLCKSFFRCLAVALEKQFSSFSFGVHVGFMFTEVKCRQIYPPDQVNQTNCFVVSMCGPTVEDILYVFHALQNVD